MPPSPFLSVLDEQELAAYWKILTLVQVRPVCHFHFGLRAYRWTGKGPVITSEMIEIRDGERRELQGSQSALLPHGLETFGS